MVTAPARRSDVARTVGAVGTIYLLHFSAAFGHAKHYTGWTADLDQRLTEHGKAKGANLLRAVKAAGITWELARTWSGTRDRERQIKVSGGASRRCPLCSGRPPRLDHLGDAP